jgi:hypothetical protein
VICYDDHIAVSLRAGEAELGQERETMSSIGLDEPGPRDMGLRPLGDVTTTKAGRFIGLRLRFWMTQVWRLRLGCPPTLQRGLAVALGALMLMWSALLNGRPAVFFDTAFYYSQAEYMAEALHIVPEDPALGDDLTSLPDEPGEPNVSATLDGARSPIYGLFVFGLVKMGTLWLAAAGQAAIVAYTLYVLYRAAVRRAGDGLFLAWMGGLCALTGLPFFTTYIMPDIFGGVAAAAALALLIYWDRVSVRNRVGLAVVLVFAMAAHKANLLTTIGVTALACTLLGVLGAGVRTVWARGATIAAAAVVAVILGALAFVPIDQRAGEKVHNPPFLMARIVADGPGYRYLQYACQHGQRYALCQFADQPDVDSDSILWSPDDGIGMFGVSDYPTRLEIERQEIPFVLGALAYDPLGEMGAALRNMALQLTMIHVRSPLADPAIFMRDDYWLQTSLPHLIPDSSHCKQWGRCASRIEPWALFVLHDVATAATLAATIWLLALIARRPGVRAALRQGLKAGALQAGGETTRIVNLILFGILMLVVNAAVCGILSAPVSRYQARMVWLLPAVTSLGFIVLRPVTLKTSLRGLLQGISSRLQRLIMHRDLA